MQRVAAVSILIIFLLPGCSSPETKIENNEDKFIFETETCNGMIVLCHRTYDDITFPETHNGHATHEDGIYYPASNHETGLNLQWNAGIRAFMIDTHYSTPNSNKAEDVRLCHGSDSDLYSPCYYGEVNAIEWLENLQTHMNSSPRDVVTLLIESHVSAEHVMYVLEQANLSQSMFVHTLGENWPTLIQLIQNDTRLIVFWEQGTAEGYPQIHDFVVHGWTTNYGEENPEEMNCDVHRGDGEQPVWHLNNWLSNSIGLSDPTRAEQVNNVEFLLERALECWEFHENRPTFIAVDWWEEGDVIAVTNKINQMTHWSDEIPS